MSKARRGNTSRPGRQTPVIMAVAGVMILAAVALAAGGPGRSDASPSPAPQSPGVAPEPAVGLTADSYSCGGTTFRPSPTSAAPSIAAATPSATSGSDAPTVDASGPGDPAVALAGVVSRLSSTLPAAGWAPEGGSSMNIVYVAPNSKAPAPFAFVDLGLVGGKWVANAYGDCEPVGGSGVAGSPLSSIPWKAAGSIDKAATTLKIMFESNLCGKALVGTTIWYDHGSVTLTLWGRSADDPDRSAGSCSTTVVTAPFTVVLAEGIGDRQLRTGPASVAKPADGAPVVVPS